MAKLVLDAGADDVGFVEIGRPALDDQREDVLQAFPGTKTLIGFVVRMNRGPIRTPARSVANLEFHHTCELVNDVARHVVRTLEDQGIRAMNPAMGFPMEMDNFPNKKTWVVSLCPVGAISPNGDFHFSACYTHNYREFLGGFTDWVEQVADSKDAIEYRGLVSDSESASMWQSPGV